MIDFFVYMVGIIHDMEIIVFTIANIIFFTNFIELVLNWKERKNEINKIQSKDEKNSILQSYFDFSKSFSITSFSFFLIIKCTFEIILAISKEVDIFLILQSIFSTALVILFICQGIAYIGVSIFISRAKKVFAKKIMIRKDLTVLQTFFEILKFILIVNSVVFVAFLVANFYITSQIFQIIIRNICLVLYVFLAICFILYKSLQIFFGIRYNGKIFNNDDFFVLSNLANNFYKGFIVLKLEEVNVDEVSNINYKILKFLKYMSMEIKYNKGRIDILFWIYADSRKMAELYGKLRTFDSEFSSLFPAAHCTRLLKPSEVEELIQKRKFHLLKSEKKAPIDFLNINSHVNKTDALLKAITTFGGLNFSIVFNYNLRDLPKSMFKKIQSPQIRYRRGYDEDKAGYKEVNSFDIINQRRMDLETKNYMDSISTGAFELDLYIFIAHDESLNSVFERERIFQSFKTLIFNIYNLNLKKPNRLEKLFLINSNRVRFRLKLFKKVFFISGNYIKSILKFPVAEHLDLGTKKNYNFSFPRPCKPGEKKIVLGKLLEHKEERDWEFPLDELRRSMTVVGIPGMGKTTFGLNILKEIRKHSVHFLVFDKKNDYTEIYNENTLFLRPGKNFFINIFKFGDSVDPSVHSEFLFNMIMELLPQREELSPAAQNLLLVSLEKTCGDKNRRSKRGLLSTIDEVAEDIVSKRNRDEVVGGLKVRLAPILKGSMGRVLKKSNLNIYEIFDHDVVIDLNYFEDKFGAGVPQVRFLVKLILRYLVYKNIAKASRDIRGVQHATVIDDASSYFKKTIEGEESYLKILIQLCRKMGEFLLILDQSSNGLDPEVIDYPNTYVAMNHSDRFSVSISKLGLPMEQGSIIPSLEKYTAIVKCNQSTSPFLIKTIKPDLTKKYSLDLMENITNGKIGELARSIFPSINYSVPPIIHEQKELLYGDIEKLRKKQEEKRLKIIKRYNQDIYKVEHQLGKPNQTNSVFNGYSIKKISKNFKIQQTLLRGLMDNHAFYTSHNFLHILIKLKNRFSILKDINTLSEARKLMKYLADTSKFTMVEIPVLSNSVEILIPISVKPLFEMCCKRHLFIRERNGRVETSNDILSYNRAILLFYMNKSINGGNSN